MQMGIGMDVDVDRLHTGASRGSTIGDGWRLTRGTCVCGRRLSSKDRSYHGFILIQGMQGHEVGEHIHDENGSQEKLHLSLYLCNHELSGFRKFENSKQCD
jgi:hypothetical protein